MSLKERLDKRVIRYRKKNMMSRSEMAKQEVERHASLVWRLFKMIFWMTQRENNQAVVYIGVLTTPKKDHYFVHKTCYMGHVYGHFMRVCWSDKVLKRIFELATEEGFRVEHFSKENSCHPNSPNVKWSGKICYDVPPMENNNL